MEGCERLLKSFWKHVGRDNEDYEEGYVVVAEEDWIGEDSRTNSAPYAHQLPTEKEKEFFHAHFGLPDEMVHNKKKRRGSKVRKPVIGKAASKKNVGTPSVFPRLFLR